MGARWDESRAELGGNEKHVLSPWRLAFDNRSVHTRFLTCEGNYCAALGALRGLGKKECSWLGLPTEGKQINMTFAFHWRIVEDKVQEGWAIFDMPGLFKQVGLDFWALAAQKKLV